MVSDVREFVDDARARRLRMRRRSFSLLSLVVGGRGWLHDAVEDVRGETWGKLVQPPGTEEHARRLTEGGELCDDLVDDLLELPVLDRALPEFWGEGEQELGVCLGEVHRGRPQSPPAHRRPSPSLSSPTPMASRALRPALAATPRSSRPRRPPRLCLTWLAHRSLSTPAPHEPSPLASAPNPGPALLSSIASSSSLHSTGETGPDSPNDRQDHHGELSDQEWEIRTGEHPPPMRSPGWRV